MLFVFFFFFKQKTAYEMRISDWSSDLCSSDLPAAVPGTRCSGYRRRTDAEGMEMNDAVPKLAVEPLDTTSSFRNQAYESLKRAITQMDIYGHHGEVRLDERQLSQEIGRAHV